jgi:hypothetical protein
VVKVSAEQLESARVQQWNCEDVQGTAKNVLSFLQQPIFVPCNLRDAFPPHALSSGVLLDGSASEQSCTFTSRREGSAAPSELTVPLLTDQEYEDYLQSVIKAHADTDGLQRLQASLETLWTSDLYVVLGKPLGLPVFPNTRDEIIGTHPAYTNNEKGKLIRPKLKPDRASSCAQHQVTLQDDTCVANIEEYKRKNKPSDKLTAILEGRMALDRQATRLLEDCDNGLPMPICFVTFAEGAAWSSGFVMYKERPDTCVLSALQEHDVCYVEVRLSFWPFAVFFARLFLFQVAQYDLADLSQLLAAANVIWRPCRSCLLRPM